MIKKFTLIFSLLLTSSLSAVSNANAYGQWVDCVIVTSAGLNSWGMYGNPAYDVKISNGCQGDVGSVTIDFDSGSYDVYSFNNRQTIYSLASYGTTKTFTLEGIKPGYYFPTLKITASQDYSSKRVNLPSFTIQAPQQPNLGNNGGTAVLPPSKSSSLATKNVCVSGSDYGPYCFDYPSWTYEICSSNPSGWVQEKVGTKWSNRWTFKGSRNSSSCTTAGIPYLITINGETTGSNSMRLSFTKTSSSAGFYSYFNLKVSSK